MTLSMRVAFPALLLLGGLTPALAHPGDHSQFSYLQLAWHLLEVDHLVFVAVTILVGVLAYRAGKRSAQRERSP